MGGGGGAPAALGGGGRAWENQWRPGKFSGGLGCAEGGRSKGLHGEVGAAAAAMARGGARAYRGELDSARGWEGSGEGGRERVLRAQRRKRGARAQVGRLGTSSPCRFERTSSACAHGDGAAWRDRETSGRIRRRGKRFWPGARRVAGQVAALAARRREQKRK